LGLVYFYFASKAELLIATCEHQAKLALARLDEMQNREQNVPPQVMLRNMLTRFIQVLDEPRTSKLLRIAALTHLPTEYKTKDNTHMRSNLHKKQINVLSLRLRQELIANLQYNLPDYPQPHEIVLEADFFSSAITTVLIRRALNHGEDVDMVKLSQPQLIDLLASNLFAWLAVKQASLAGNMSGWSLS